MMEIDAAHSDPPAAEHAASSRLGFETLVLKLGTYVYALPGSIVLARALGPAGRGSYQVAVTASLVVLTVVLLGLPQSQFRLWGSIPVRRMLGATRLAAVVLGSLGAAACVALAIAGGPVFDGSTGRALVLLAFSIPVQVNAACVMVILQSSALTRHVNIALAIAGFIQTSLILGLAALGRLDVVTAAAAYTAGLGLQSLLLWRSARGLGRAEAVASWGLLLRFVRSGMILQAFIVANFLLMRIDLLLLAHISDLEEVGIYSVAVTLAELVWLVTDSLAQVLVERATRSNEFEALEVFVRAVRMSLFLGLLAAICAAGFAPWGIRLLFGGDFAEAAPVLAILLPAAVAMGCWRAVSPAVVRFGSIWYQPLTSLLALVVNVGLNLVLMSRLGAIGAAISSMVAYFFLMLTSMWWLLRRTGAGLRSLLPGRRELGLVLQVLRVGRP